MATSLDTLDLLACLRVQHHHLVSFHVGNQDALVIRRELQAVGTLGRYGKRLHHLLGAHVNDRDAAVLRMRNPNFAPVGRHVDALWPFTHGDRGPLRVRRPLTFPDADAVRLDVGSEDFLPVFANYQHVGPILTGAPTKTSLAGTVVTTNLSVS